MLSVSVLGITALIFLNSFLDFSASHKLSGAIMKFLFPNTTEINGVADDFWLRKTAHFIEYTLLGVTVGGIIVFFKRQFSKIIIGGSLFGLLMVAVIDEFIQGFRGRNSSVADVILDFCSALLGLMLTFLICRFITHIKSKHKN